ncbi:unnamed protein product [Thlaspi arvense]|uniref:Uncharacterized protein n=1 Tax=Thlaspi arvense TaxID=13288 RepID=A0AAU9RF67_THLAR|nr:unnamed protein product [Thlaspi arvense]
MSLSLRFDARFSVFLSLPCAILRPRCLRIDRKSSGVPPNLGFGFCYLLRSGTSYIAWLT